jgi:hypothetical protein
MRRIDLFNPLRGCRDRACPVSTRAISSNADNSPVFRAASPGRRPVRGSMTRGDENHALQAAGTNLRVRPHPCVFTRISTTCETTPCSTSTAVHQYGLKSRIYITADHRPAERTRRIDLFNPLRGCRDRACPVSTRAISSNADNSPVFQAALPGRWPVRWSMTRGDENPALRAAPARTTSSINKQHK